MKTALRKLVIVALWPVIVVVLVVPVGVSVGTLLGLVEDFGLSYTAENMRHNPAVFADQYASQIVFTGWAAVVDLAVLAAIAGVVLIRGYGKRPTRGDKR